MSQPKPFPRDKFAALCAHRLWQPFLDLGLNMEDWMSWPSPEEWTRWAQNLAAFKSAVGPLQFVAEHRPGARRLRKEKKAARLQPGLRSYESRVIEKGEVATRPEHPHDLFNAMIWLRYPCSKNILHNLAYKLQQEVVPGLHQRTPAADSLTCFDEGGVFYRCQADEDPEALQTLFCSRDDAGKAQLCRLAPERFAIFGHGLMEGLLLHDLAAVQVSCLALPFRTFSPEDPYADSLLANTIETTIALQRPWGTLPFAALWTRPPADIQQSLA